MAKSNQLCYLIAQTENCAAQLSSLLVLLYGNDCKTFNSLFEHDRDNVLWLDSDLATRVDKGFNGKSGGCSDYAHDVTRAAW
ncbi:hypothetical protein [Alcaligenes sp. CHO6]|uniref:hypothetical protein n=1 Tax=Alcaligenes sp. CHO6 TaxID=3123298 RepID=UPI0030154AF7